MLYQLSYARNHGKILTQFPCFGNPKIQKISRGDKTIKKKCCNCLRNPIQMRLLRERLFMFAQSVFALLTASSVRLLVFD